MVLSVLVLAFFLAIWLSPKATVTHFNKTMLSDSVFTDAYKTHYDDPSLAISTAKLANTRALLQLADKDSINLIINFRDSIIALSIKGVTIHQATLTSQKADPIFKGFSNRQYLYYFGKPLEILEQKATIVKEPIVIRHAPKDPLEAAQNAFLPDTLIQDPAFVELILENNIGLFLTQDSIQSSAEKTAGRKFTKQLRRNRMQSNIGQFFRFQKVVYEPKVQVSLPAADLRAIYRALPAKAFVVIII